MDNVLSRIRFQELLLKYQIINYNGIRFEDYFEYYKLSLELDNYIESLKNEIANIKNKYSNNKYELYSKVEPLDEKLKSFETALISCHVNMNYINSANVKYLEVLSK